MVSRSVAAARAVPASTILIMVVVWLLSIGTATAQINTQLWANLTFDWLKSEKLTYSLDLEPKVLLRRPAGEPGWANLDVRPGAEYAWISRIDLVGDVTVGPTHQTDDVSSLELTPRIGVRFHLFSRDLKTLGRRREQVPRRRIVVRDLFRVEWRNFYNSGAPDQSSARLRNRVEFLIPLNRAKLSDDGARYLLADWEWFIPIEDIDERFANRQRVRTGLGLRPNARWRFEAVYAWTRSRETIEDDFATADNIFNVRVKRVFQ